ncbi:MAG: DUF3108 domain-containing protein [Bacteroidota bacterium]
MKKITVTLIAIFVTAFASAQTLRNINTGAFQPNEVLEYRVHYGFMDAGEARLEIAPNISVVNGRKCIHVIGTGRTVGAFDWFFKVRDRYESFIDNEALLPWMFIRKIEEGDYTKEQNVKFNHYKKTASSEKKTINTPTHVQDIISAFYFARTLDFTHASPGDTFTIMTYLDDETFPLTIKYIGKETIKTKAGKFRCIAFHPMLLEGRVFKEQDGMTVWVSDDKNRIPIRAEAEILVGSVKMDLKDYKGVANPLALIK